MGDSNNIWIGQVLTIPKDGIAVLGLKSDPKPSRYPWPVKGSITKHYGGRHDAFHHGLDVAAPTGTEIRAVDGGQVVWAGWKTIYGMTVIIEHGNERRTLYGHASKILVHKGQRVVPGQVISKVGNTGRSTGPHLHFEIYDQGRTVNPLAYLE
jgi:murein DD-endopeptidase MepM/ murein hydrolase activator NlpD